MAKYLGFANKIGVAMDENGEVTQWVNQGEEAAGLDQLSQAYLVQTGHTFDPPMTIEEARQVLHDHYAAESAAPAAAPAAEGSAPAA